MTTTAITRRPVRHRLLGDFTWHQDAVCTSTEYHRVDPDMFFPEPEATDTITAAKALCGQCPVRRTCLDAALEAGDAEGIRGGLTEEERAPLHEKLPHRLDYTRVNEAVAGRDIHLTTAERQAVAQAAYNHGLTEQRLAVILKISEEHAQKLYRKIRRAHRNRDLKTTTPAQPVADRRPTRNDLGTAA
jgi:WhiB family redox-sensing transcriptional regulator